MRNNMKVGLAETDRWVSRRVQNIAKVYSLSSGGDDDVRRDCQGTEGEGEQGSGFIPLSGEMQNHPSREGTGPGGNTDQPWEMPKYRTPRACQRDERSEDHFPVRAMVGKMPQRTLLSGERGQEGPTVFLVRK